MNNIEEFKVKIFTEKYSFKTIEINLKHLIKDLLVGDKFECRFLYKDEHALLVKKDTHLELNFGQIKLLNDQALKASIGIDSRHTFPKRLNAIISVLTDLDLDQITEEVVKQMERIIDLDKGERLRQLAKEAGDPPGSILAISLIEK
jgi:hypothetical protein